MIIHSEQIDLGPPEPQEICASESTVNVKLCEEPSTSQTNPNDHSAANELIDILDADSEFPDPPNSSNVERYKYTYGRSSSQMVQVKLEPMDCDATADFVNDRNKKKKSDEEPYYRRKVFKKEKEQSFHVDNLLDDWDDDAVRIKSQANKDALPSSDPSDMDDVISIASGATEATDSSFEFVGQPYFDATINTSDQEPSTSSNR